MACGLNGSNQFLTVPVDTAFEFGTGDFTVALRLQIGQLKENVPIMLGDGANASPIVQCAWCIRHFNGFLYWYRYEHPTETYYTFSWSPSLNVPYSVVISRISGSLRAYVDGAQIGSTISTNVSYNRINTNNLRIGRADFGTTPFYYNGQLADVAVWNAAGLNAQEVLALSRGFTADQIRPQSLSFYAPLVRDLVDVRGGLTITNNNGATVATHPRIIT